MEGEVLKSKVENFDVDTAIKNVVSYIDNAASLCEQYKKLKYNYLVQTCELYTRVDLPSIMIEEVRKEVRQNIPSAKDVRKLNN